MKVCIPTTYTFRPAGAQVVGPAEQSSVSVAEGEPEEAPLDLDSALSRLDAELQKLDELTAKERTFPAELASIEKKHEALTKLYDHLRVFFSTDDDLTDLVFMLLDERVLAGPGPDEYNVARRKLVRFPFD
jgi:hypothetical protein